MPEWAVKAATDIAKELHLEKEQAEKALELILKAYEERPK